MNFERVANHIYAPTVVTVQTTKAFRKPFVIRPFEDFVEAAMDACESLEAFRTFDAPVIDANGKGVRPVAEVTLHVKPHSDSACNLTVIEPVPFISCIGLMAGDHNEQVTFEIDWFASSITLAQGSLIRSKRTVDDYQFTFLFAQVIRD